MMDNVVCLIVATGVITFKYYIYMTHTHARARTRARTHTRARELGLRTDERTVFNSTVF